MKPYKGPAILSCEKDCKKETRINASCLNCPDVKIELFDLEEKKLASKKVIKPKKMKEK